LADKIPQDQKDKVQGQLERGKHFLAEEYFPEERRDQFIFRCKKVCCSYLACIACTHTFTQVIIECQKHDDYQESLRWLLNFINEYAEHGKSIAKEGQSSQEKVTSVRLTDILRLSHSNLIDSVQDPALKQATKELRTLLERFANNQSIDPIIDAFNVLSDDATRDPKLREWFKEIDSYIRKVCILPTIRTLVYPRPCRSSSNLAT